MSDVVEMVAAEIVPDVVEDDRPSSLQQQPPRRADPMFQWTILALCTGATLAALLLSAPGRSSVVVPFLNYPLPELCAWKRFSGVGCPGCGLTRCFISMAHGDVVRAFQFNPAGVPLFVLMVLQIPYRIVQLRRIKRGLAELQWRWMGVVCGSIPALLIGQWVIRLLLGVRI